MTAPFTPFQEHRPWGNFQQFTQNTSSTIKIITIKPGQALSLQTHEKRSEFWKIISGNGIVEIAGMQHEAQTGDEFTVPQKTKHRISTTHSELQLLEIATGEFDEQDIIRYEDNYGRSNV